MVLMAAKTELIGLNGLLDQFKRLSSEMTQRTARRMVATAGGILRKEAKAIAQAKGLNRSGAMIRNIAIKRERNTREGTEQYNLGVRHGKQLKKAKKKDLELFLRKNGRIVWRRTDDPFYWRFLEFGTKSINPFRFMQQSLENKHNEAIEAMKKRLEDDLRKAGR